jgi:phage terminase Nu1 subunit (DNA packaging protein)
MTWQSTCEALWGPDWIAPLSEVLAVNRRTVERWKSGDVPIPDHIEAEIVRLPRLGDATRAYGDLLRRLSGGETVADVEQWIAAQRRAIARYKADTGKYRAIAVLAAGQREIGN